MKTIDLDLDDKALLIPARMDSQPFSIYVIN